jgi:hypothetical protein
MSMVTGVLSKVTVRAGSTVTVARFDVAQPPFESVTVTETEPLPAVVEVTVQEVLVGPHPDSAVNPLLSDQE